MSVSPLPRVVSLLGVASAHRNRRRRTPADDSLRSRHPDLRHWLHRCPAVAHARASFRFFVFLFVLCLPGPAGLRAQLVAQAQLSDLGSFSGANGQVPEDGLVLSGNTLYGTTYSGGANGVGEVFSVPLGGGAPTVLGSFNGVNGQNPEAGLLVSAGTLFGVTSTGGANSDGAVFSMPVGGGTPTLLTSFTGADGKTPVTGLLLSQDGSTLYGTTYQGGASGNYGTVFSLPVAGGTPTLLTSFNLTNGSQPNGRLTLIGSSLYGVAQNGGASGAGVVFSVPVGGGTPTVLATFNGTNGQSPEGGLTLIGIGTLYGITEEGGAFGDGAVFSVPLGGGTPTVLASFNGANGRDPDGGLVLSQDGSTFSGVTVDGGANDDGVVYSVPVAGGTPTALASFNVANGDEPLGELVLNGGILYGATTGGGSSGDGVIFAVPEPGSATLLLAGALAAIARRRRACPV